MMSFWGMARVAEMRRQFGLQHLFERVGKQAREDTLLAEEIVDTFRPSQLLLNALNRGQYGWCRLLTVNHGVTSFLFVRRGSIPQTNDWVVHHLHNLFYTLQSPASLGSFPTGGRLSPFLYDGAVQHTAHKKGDVCILLHFRSTFRRLTFRRSSISTPSTASFRPWRTPANAGVSAIHSPCS